MSGSSNTGIAPLACSVRGCGLPLTRHDRTLVCSAGHSFDIARNGYINLLQPQDRRSISAGDSKAAVEARAALEQSGIGRAVIDAVVQTTTALELPSDAIAVDLGSGSGEMLGRLWSERSISGIGIDLSVAAVEFAARRLPSLTWVVANADRRLPLQDNSVDLVLSIHGRRNPSECARVLKTTGALIVVLPAPDDLLELRTLVQGQGVERDRIDAMLREHQEIFTVAETSGCSRNDRSRTPDVAESAARHLSRRARLERRAGKSARKDPSDIQLASRCPSTHLKDDQHQVGQTSQNSGGSEDPPLL